LGGAAATAIDTRAVRRVLLVTLTACSIDAPMTATHESSIIGPSHPAASGELAATGALLSKALGDPALLCTGTLITPTAVLTAAHCVDPSFIGDEIPSFTFERYAFKPPEPTIHAGASRHPHPEFAPNQPPAQLGHANDVGILILAEPITDVAPAALVRAGDPITVDLAVTLTGYGYSNGNDPDAGIPGFQYKRVGEASISEVGDWEVALAHMGEAGACDGDSGGPAYATFGDGIPRITATVSRGLGFMDCSKGGVFTRVDRYLDWITSVTGGTTGAADAGVPDAPGSPDETRDHGGCGCRANDPRGGLICGLLVVVLRRRRARPALRTHPQPRW
jgi:hypothetical protein